MRLALCDDNSIFLKDLHQLILSEFKYRNIKVDITDYTKGNVMIYHHKLKPFDAIFLDIDMPKTSGFYIAREFVELDKNCQLIFVTAHSELIYDSFLFRPLNFITKTDEDSLKERLSIVIDQLLEHFKQETKIVLEDKKHGRTAVFLRDVIYIASNNHHVSYYVVNSREPIIVRDSISNLEGSYADHNFVRIHKKYLVNLSHVFNISLTKEVVIFKQKFDLPMSRNYKEKVDNKLTEYLRKTR